MNEPKPLRPQDLVLAIGLAALDRPASVRELQAAAGASSPSRVHASLGRLRDARLLGLATGRLLKRPLLEIIDHAVRWVFPAEVGPEAIGVPTAHAIGPLSTRLLWSRPYVWPNRPGDSGGVTGNHVEPLHDWAYGVAANIPGAHELLALTDSIRVGRVREQKMAKEHLHRTLEPA